jgi:hypothetical protein
MQNIHELGSVDANLVVQPTLLAVRNIIDAAINGVSIISTAGTAYSKQYSVVQMRETDANGHVSDVTDESRRSYAKFELQDLLRRLRQTQANIAQYSDSISDPETVSTTAQFNDLRVVAQLHSGLNGQLNPQIHYDPDAQRISCWCDVSSAVRFDPRVDYAGLGSDFSALNPSAGAALLLNSTGGLKYVTPIATGSWSPYQNFWRLSTASDVLAAMTAVQYFIPVITLTVCSSKTGEVLRSRDYGIAVWYEGDRIHAYARDDDPAVHQCKVAPAELAGNDLYYGTPSDEITSNDRHFAWHIPLSAIVGNSITAIHPSVLAPRAPIQSGSDPVLPNSATIEISTIADKNASWSSVNQPAASFTAGIIYSKASLEISGLSEVINTLLPDFAAAEAQLIALTE